jgi:transporter family-2 protein
VSREVAVALTAATGGLVALQAPINSVLGHRIGTWQAAFLSFAIGTAALALVATFATGGMGRIGEARGIGWIYLTGGVLGACYVTAIVVTVRPLGVGGVVAATIAGQLAVGVLVDHFGWLGAERQPVSLARVAGVALLAAGTYLVVRD